MEVRLYPVFVSSLHDANHTAPPDLSLSQILPMLDEETGQEPRINSASIADPYMLLIRDDFSVFVAQIDNNMELEEVEKEDKILTTTKWLTGCLYVDSAGVFAEEVAAKGDKPKESILIFLLSTSGALHVRISTARETDNR